MSSDPRPAYQPVDCGFYDVLELSAMRGRPCEVVLSQPDGHVTTLQTRILDVFSEGKEEFVQLEEGGKVRLDRLVSVDGTARPGAACRW